MKKFYKKYNRLFLFMLTIFILSMYIYYPTHTSQITEKYVVKEGDSLWKIASEYHDDCDNILEDIYNIKKDNNLNNANLKVGQVLVIKKRLASNN